jgi:hypothetical protein
MAQDFIFAHDVILDPDTAKVVAVVRNGGVWRDGTRIAVLVGAHMYDLNGNLLGKLAGDGSLPDFVQEPGWLRDRTFGLASLRVLESNASANRRSTTSARAP